MRFEHLVQINDRHNPLIGRLSRNQLWNGLVFRVLEPMTFVLGLDAFTIVSRSGTTIKRELRFGPTVITDHVTLTPPEKVHYAIPQGDGHPAGSLTMAIEEPSPGDLFVRFTYECGSSEGETGDEIEYDAFRKQAYFEADVDTVRRIRELVEQGAF